MAARRDEKGRNRTYLSKVFALKTNFYPLIHSVSRLKNYRLAEKIINPFIRLAGVNKNVHFFFKYRDYGSWFRGRFEKAGDKKGVVLFPMMAGVNSNFTLLNLLFAEYFRKEDGLRPMFYICDAALGICTKDGTLKSRDKFPHFCNECYRGYDHIESQTGIDILRISTFTEGLQDEMDSEFRKIDRLGSQEECEGYSFRGTAIGLMARKSVLRYFLVGRLLFSEEVREVYHRFLRSGVRYHMAFSAMLEQNRDIRYMIVNNGSLLYESVARSLCRERGIDYMTYETYIGNNSIVYKKNGPVMDFNWEDEYRSFMLAYKPGSESEKRVSTFFSNLEKGVEMYAVLNREGGAPVPSAGGSYACLFTNLNFDTAVIDKNFLFEDMESWIYSVIDYWKREKPGPDLVIRVHPGELKLLTATREFLGDRIKRAAAGAVNITVVDSDEKASSYDLLRGMEFGLIYSSTIGLEIAREGKACLVAGEPWFRHRKFIIYPASREEYFNELGRLCSGESVFKPDQDELSSTVDFVFYNRVKRFNNIKFYTPREEPNTLLDDPDKMIGHNREFFDSFRKELYDE